MMVQSHIHSNTAGVQHDADSGSHGTRGKVGAELGTDGSRVSVGSGEAAPDDTVVAALLLGAGSVDVGNALAQVPINILTSIDTLDLDEGGVGLLVALGSEANYFFPNKLKVQYNERCKIKIDMAKAQTSGSTKKRGLKKKLRDTNLRNPKKTPLV
jgi:hypothetical protein